ncbi:MAG: sigma-70 family RNA polymerase sigma factor [Actinomycetota bacterium]
MIDTDAHRSGPASTVSGSDVITGAGAGHRDFASFYHAQYPAQLRRAAVLARSADEAADAVQQAFVDVYRRWSDLSHPDRYLTRAVVNRCRDGGRRASARDRLRLRLVREPAPIVTEAPVADEELWSALTELPFNQRAAIVLRYYGGHTEAEIADLLDCSAGSVGPWITRGLARLRKALS